MISIFVAASLFSLGLGLLAISYLPFSPITRDLVVFLDTRARAVNPLSIDRATKEVLHWPRQSTEVRSARPNRSSDQGRERRRRSHGIVVGAFKRQEDRQSLIVFDAR